MDLREQQEAGVDVECNVRNEDEVTEVAIKVGEEHGGISVEEVGF